MDDALRLQEVVDGVEGAERPVARELQRVAVLEADAELLGARGLVGRADLDGAEALDGPVRDHEGRAGDLAEVLGQLIRRVGVAVRAGFCDDDGLRTAGGGELEKRRLGRGEGGGCEGGRREKEQECAFHGQGSPSVENSVSKSHAMRRNEIAR